MKPIEYLPVPFVPNGRDREGVDCWGLVCLIYVENLNIPLPHYDGVDWEDGDAVASSLTQEAKVEWVEIDGAERREYDVVVLRIKGLPWHVGVLVDQQSFIHARPAGGVCIERLSSIHWKNRIIGFYRHMSLSHNVL